MSIPITEALRHRARARADRSGPDANPCDYTEWKAADRIAALEAKLAAAAAEIGTAHAADLDEMELLRGQLHNALAELGRWKLETEIAASNSPKG